MSSDMILAALRRKRAIAAGAGLALDAADLDRRIAQREGRPAPAEVAEPESEADDEPAELEMTAAARRKANELGLTDSDFAGQQPSGQTGYTVNDVERIAAARYEADTLDDEDDD